MKVLALNDCASVAATLTRETPEVDLVVRGGMHFSAFGEKVLSMDGPRIKTLPREGAHRFRGRLVKLAKNYDLIHACGWSAVHAYLAGLPYGMIFHGTDIRNWGHPRGFKEYARFALDVLTLKNAKYVAVSTPDLIPFAHKWRPDAIYMPNPIKLSEFSPTGSVQGFDDQIIAFSPHRIDETKGHPQLYGAVSPFPWLHVIQSDWGLGDFYAKTKREAPKNVHFIPLIKRGEIASYYRGATMVLGQIVLGAVGMSELEAAACRRPVVCYSVFGFPGLRKPPSLDVLRDVIAGIVFNPTYAHDLAEKQYRYVVENHDSAKVAKRWREVWKNAV